MDPYPMTSNNNGSSAANNADAFPTKPVAQPFEHENLSATLSNSETTINSLPLKLPQAVDDFSSRPEPVPAAEPLQPVREVETSIVDEEIRAPPRLNGDSARVLESSSLPVNGFSSPAAVNGGALVDTEPSPRPEFASPPISQLPEVADSSFAATSTAPSSMPAEPPAMESIHAPIEKAPQTSADFVAPTLEQAPVSDLRSVPEPVPADSAAALRIRSDKQELDVANDSDLADALEIHHVEPIPAPEPSLPVTSTDQPLQDEGVEMDVSFEAAPPVTLPSPQKLPSPPPAPEAEPATLATDPPAEPKPSLPTPQPAIAVAVDQPMVDAILPPPTKMTREREEYDDDAEPMAKRARTDVESSESTFKVPDAPQSQAMEIDTGDQNKSAAAVEPLTPARLSHFRKVMANLKKGKASEPFRRPVDWQALNIPNYPQIIKEPMDLGTMDQKLKNNEYKSVEDFTRDFNLIVGNCTAFNGPEHLITLQAVKMKQSFDSQMASLPKAEFAEPSREEKKAQKFKEQPTRSIPARRQSNTASARSPTASSNQTFALGPEGVPLIRRDSTITGDRPKRTIHPPKHRDEMFGAGRPKKKKFEWQLKFCVEVMKEITKQKHWAANQYFLHPVDPVALNIPTYYSVIKKPMDLETVQNKLTSNAYEKAKDFEEDVRLIFKNCYKFNQQGDVVYSSGQQLERLFDHEWANKDAWIADHEPVSEPLSPQSGDEDDDISAEESGEDDSEAERNEKIALIQKQIEMMSKQMGELAQPKKKKKSKSPAGASKKTGKSKKKDSKPASFSAPQSAMKEKKKAKPKPEKERFVTYNEKQYISEGISSLPDAKMSEALRIIQANVPSLKDTAETEIELDIDELPNAVLLKLLSFVKKYVPAPAPEVKAEPIPVPAAPAARPKKNKPMNKAEQEAQIEELKGKLGSYQQGGPVSPSTYPSVEQGDSSEDDDSEESEEE